MRSSRTILVVDDDAILRRLIEATLSMAGYCVITASNGEEGVDRIQREQPDAVVTDLNMLGVSGKDLCERTDPLKAARPFLTVVLTASVSPGATDWIRGMTNTVLMEKPFSPKHLRSVVDELLGMTGGVPAKPKEGDIGV